MKWRFTAAALTRTCANQAEIRLAPSARLRWPQPPRVLSAWFLSCASLSSSSRSRPRTPSSSTPIGPFCPSAPRRARWRQLDGDFQQPASGVAQFVMEMSRMQLDMQMGKEPDRGKMAELALQLDGRTASGRRCWRKCG